jgi:hypothetical protein
MHLFKLSDYKISGRQVRKTVGLSDIRYQTQTTGLSDIRYKKTTDCRALVACEVAEPDNRARKQSRVAESGSRVG